LTSTTAAAGGLSSGAEIGIGVGVGLGVAGLLVGLATFLFYHRRIRRLEQSRDGASGSGQPLNRPDLADNTVYGGKQGMGSPETGGYYAQPYYQSEEHKASNAHELSEMPSPPQA
jgi:hypothetical protein